MNDVLALYDYGSGGVWSVIRCVDPKHVTERFPWLQVLERPSWMTDDEYASIRSTAFWNLDDPPDWILRMDESQK
jgi:hypothetical protein